MKLEACIETLAEAKLAAKHNLNRVELCSALDLGGLTPSAALIRACAEVIETHVMIRPRAGNFVFSTLEMALMMEEIAVARDFGATGVVFGCLTIENKIDFALSQHLVLAAHKNSLQCTFHRAFDFLEDQKTGLEQLIKLDFDRLLTSGGADTAQKGVENLARLVKDSNGRIEIMAGSGVNASNILELQHLGIDAAHFSIRKKTGEKVPLGMGEHYEPDEEKIIKILNVLKR